MDKLNACWKKIGVWAPKEDRACDILLDVVHCHNCDVYIQSGRVLLNRASTVIAEDNINWTENKKQQKINKQEWQSHIVVNVAGQQIAIPSELVTEVARSNGVHSIPHKRNNVIAGMVNISGKTKICFSLAKLLNISDSSSFPEKTYLLISYEGQEFVIQVDEVKSHTRYHQKDINEVSTIDTKSQYRIVTGVISYNNTDTLIVDRNALMQELENRLYE